MKFFKSGVILYFSVGFLLSFFFFSGELVEAIARRICMKYGTNVSSCVGFRIHIRNFEKIKKPGHDEQKTSWNRSIFQPHRHVHAHCYETVEKLWMKLTNLSSSVLYLSENVFVTAYNRLIFSVFLLYRATKFTNFGGHYLENEAKYGRSFY